MDKIPLTGWGVILTLLLFVLRETFSLLKDSKKRDEMEELKWKLDLSSTVRATNKLLEKLSDKGDDRAEVLTEVKKDIETNINIHKADHKRLGKIDANLDLLNKLYAK